MTITDPEKKTLALNRHLHFQVCYKCHTKNHFTVKTCKRCGSHELRKKHNKQQLKKG